MKRSPTEIPIALGAFIYYVWICAPGVEWLDSGELSAASFALGVSHPPGQPAYTLICKLASLLPVGEVAFRVTLISALSAAAAVFAVFSLARVLVDAKHANTALGAEMGAALGATLLATSPQLVEQAARPEVYAPAAALIAWGARFAVAFVRRPGGAAGDAICAALLFGLGAAVHPLLAAAAALPLGVAIAAAARRRLIRLAPLLAAAGLLGLGANLYLLARAAAPHPALLVWGEPSTPGRLIEVVLARAYGGNFALAGLGGRIVGHLSLAGEGTGSPVLFIGAAGLLFGAVTRLRGAGGLLAAAALLVVVTAAQKVFHPENPDVHGYVLAALPLLAAGMAAATAAVTRVAGLAALPIALVPIGLLAFAGPHRFVDGAPRRGEDPLRYHDATVGTLPPGPAVYLADSDHALFPAQYERVVAGARPDVALANEKLLRSSWFLRSLRRAVPQVWLPWLDDGGQLHRMAGRLIEENRRRGLPVWGEEPNLDRVPATPVDGSLAYDYAPRTAGTAPPPRIYAGDFGRRVAHETGLIRAGWELDHGRWLDAARAAGILERLSPEEQLALGKIPAGTHPLEADLPRVTPIFVYAPWQLDVLERDLRIVGSLPLPLLPADAPAELHLIDAWAQILAGTDVPLRPDDRMATARMLLHHDRPDAAEAQLRAAGSDEPAQLLLAALLANRGRLDDAAQILQQHPDSARAQAQLGVVYAKQSRMPEAAAAFRRSLELDPDQPEVRALLERVKP